MRSPRLGAALPLLVGLVAMLFATVGPAAAAELPTEPVGRDTAVLAQDGGETVRGTLQDGQEPVPGVEITISTADGSEIGTVTTGDDGSWELPVPGPGDYTATLDESTLPEDVGLRAPDRNPLEFSIRPGQSRTLIFALGERSGGTAGFGSKFASATLNGLSFGLIIAMTAIGLSLIFGTTGLVNFAHGELVTLGAVIAWFFNAPTNTIGIAGAIAFALFMAPSALLLRDRSRKLRTEAGPAVSAGLFVGGWAVFTLVLLFMPGDIQIIGAAAIAIALSGAVGAGLERGLWRPLRRRRTGLIQMLVISIGLSLVLRNAIQYAFGGRSRPYFDYTIQSSLDFGWVQITPRGLWIIGISVVTLVGVATMLQRTRIGKAMRAVSDNKDLAESSGIDVQRVILFVWILGAGLAGLGGILFGLDQNVSFLLGFRLLLLIFAGVILGGLGTAYGAFVGSLVIGLITKWSSLWLSPELELVWGLLALIVVLLFRPQGLLGRKERFG